MTMSSAVPSTILAEFQVHFQGTLLTAADADYSTARGVWNAAVDHHPAVIARPHCAEGVAQAVRFARQQRLGVAVRGGGHSPAGFGTIEGGIVIDLISLKRLIVNPETRFVRVEAGLTWGEVAATLHEHGLAITAGDAASVGVAGLTQGGGIGWMARHYGLATDRLRAVELVTADGTLLRTSDTEHPELFWALRGAGANFGVITALEFEAHAGGTVYGGALFFDGQDAARLLAAYAKLALHAPDALTTQAVLIPAPPAPFVPSHLVGRPLLGILACWSGDVTAGEQALAPFRALGAPVADLMGPMPYPAMFELTRAGEQRGLGHASRSGFLDELPDATLAALVREASRSMQPHSIVQLRVLGGQLRHGEGAFAHRERPYLLMVDQGYAEADQRDAAWSQVERLWSVCSPLVRGQYGNFVATRDVDSQAEVFGPQALARLAQLKAQFDPHNVFARNLNIQPSVRDAVLI